MANPAPTPGNDGGNGNLANIGLNLDPSDAEPLRFSRNKSLNCHEDFPDNTFYSSNSFAANLDQLIPFEMVESAVASAGGDDDNGGKKSPVEIPLAFRFDPTDEDVMVYLRNKIMGGRDDLPDFIPTTDVFGTSPDQLPFDSCKYSTGKKWLFYTAEPSQDILCTGDGYWYATFEEDMHIGGRVDAYKKEFVYYHGLLRPGKRTNWCIYKYRLNPEVYAATAVVDNDVNLKISNVVICMVFCKEVRVHSHRPKGKRKRENC